MDKIIKFEDIDLKSKLTFLENTNGYVERKSS